MATVIERVCYLGKREKEWKRDKQQILSVHRVIKSYVQILLSKLCPQYAPSLFPTLWAPLGCNKLMCQEKSESIRGGNLMGLFSGLSD